jgi:predicted O-methyltransferase YrrM
MDQMTRLANLPLPAPVRRRLAASFHQHVWIRRALAGLAWPKLRAGMHDLSHLAFYVEEDAVGPMQRDEALALHALLRVVRPRRVVEFGFLHGRSSFNMLRALDPEARLWAFDIDPTARQFATNLLGHDPRFTLRLKSQDAIEAKDVDGGPVDVVLLDASHDLELNKRTFARLVPLLAERALVVIHDTGAWAAEHLRPPHAAYASAAPHGWVADGYAHQLEERLFVNWVADEHPKFAHVHLHSANTLRHGMTVLQRSAPLPTEQRPQPV